MTRTETPRPASRSLSTREFRVWVDEHDADLRSRGITGRFSSGWEPSVRLRSTWISLSSRWAEGRVVRHGDGASEWTAHRTVDGAELMAEQRPTCVAKLTDVLVDLLSEPGAGDHTGN
jgi:hypothetical protein